MRIFRPILSLILVLATTILVSCGGQTASAPPTYTPEKLQKVATYRIPFDIARQRMSELGEYIDNEDWVNADTFIHGPLGSIRRDLTYLSRALLDDEQEPALEAAKDIFKHFENIDAAIADTDYSTAIKQYKEVVSDLDAYATLLPQTQKEEDPAEAAMESAERVFAGVKEEIEETVDRVTPDFEDNA